MTNMAEVELIMPRMGESIIEATIISWLKKEGEYVEAEETVLEIATDKVDSEVPAPVSGVLKKILHQKDDVVAVGAPLAIIDTEVDEEVEDDAPPSTEAPSAAKEKDAEKPSTKAEADHSTRTDEGVQHPQRPDKLPPEKEAPKKTPAQLIRKSLATAIPSNAGGKFYSPLVRNIARAEGITLEELDQLNGSGADGRVTKMDLLNYIDLLRVESTSSIKRAETVQQPKNLQINQASSESAESPSVSRGYSFNIAEQSDEIIEVSRMRKVIADHMKQSLDTAAHVTSFVEADATRIVNWRSMYKDDFESKYGQKLTFTPIFAEIVANALRDFPMINASFDGGKIHLKKEINIGIATAMENGNLIVPVIKDAGGLNLLGLAKRLNDVTARARKNDLKPDEIQGGTFTISNIGTYGNIMGTPIILQPQLAILALGAIRKKPVIKETAEGDIIAIRNMMFLSLSFDHRVIDGLQGGVFLNRIAEYIENFDTNRPI